MASRKSLPPNLDSKWIGLPGAWADPRHGLRFRLPNASDDDVRAAGVVTSILAMRVKRVRMAESLLANHLNCRSDTMRRRVRPAIHAGLVAEVEGPGRTRWLQVTDLGLSEYSAWRSKGWWRLDFARLHQISRPTPLAYWVEAAVADLTRRHKTPTAAEVARMIHAPRTSVANHFERHLRLVTDAPVIQIDPDRVDVIAGNQSDLDTMLEELTKWFAITEFTRRKMNLYANGQYVGTFKLTGDFYASVKGRIWPSIRLADAA